MAGSPRRAAALRRRQAVIFALTFAIYAGYHATRKAYTNAKLQLRDELGMSHSFLGTLDTLFLLCYAAGLFVSGIAGDALPPARVLAVGGALTALLTAAMGLLAPAGAGSTSPAYLVVWGANGLLQSTGWPTTVTIVTRWFASGSRGSVFGLWTACQPLGNIMGSLLVLLCVEVRWGVPLMFALPAIFLIVCIVLGAAFLEGSPRDAGFGPDDALELEAEGRAAHSRPGAPAVTAALSAAEKAIERVRRRLAAENAASSAAGGSAEGDAELELVDVELAPLALGDYYGGGDDDDDEKDAGKEERDEGEAAAAAGRGVGEEKEEAEDGKQGSSNDSVAQVKLRASPAALAAAERGEAAALSESKPYRSDSQEKGPLSAGLPLRSSQSRGEEGALSEESHGAAAAGTERRVSCWEALSIPGVVEYSLSYACLKFVNYALLFWLPMYLHEGLHLSYGGSDLLSNLYDVGAVFGGLLAGWLSDRTGRRSPIMVAMLVASFLAIALLVAARDVAGVMALLLLVGFCVGGPAGIMNSAVAADLGASPAHSGNARALSTVTGIVDGTGSLGAALGQKLVAVFSSRNWRSVFAVLLTATALSVVCIAKIFWVELRQLLGPRVRSYWRLADSEGERGARPAERD